MGLRRLDPYAAGQRGHSWGLTTKMHYNNLFEAHQESRWNEIARVTDVAYETYMSRPYWYIRLL